MTLLQDMTHNKLMMRFQHHLDEAAFAQLVSAYTGPAVAVARRILNDCALAEDAVQEAFLRVIRRRDQFILRYSALPGKHWTSIRCYPKSSLPHRKQPVYSRLS